MLKRRHKIYHSLHLKKMAMFKTDHCFTTHLDEHGSRHDQPMFQHLVNCQ